MSISSETDRNDYVGNGSVSTYSYSFRIFSSSHLLVTTLTSAGVESTLVLNTDYTVTGVGNSSGTIVLTTALASGTDLTIRRVLPITQTTDFRNQGSFFPESHEDALDRGIMIAQQQQDEIDRSLKVPETEDSIGALPSLADRAGMFLAFDTDGDPVAGAGTTPSSVTVSAFAETLLDDISAAAAQATLLLGSENITFVVGKGPICTTPDGLHTWMLGVDNDGNPTSTQVS